MHIWQSGFDPLARHILSRKKIRFGRQLDLDATSVRRVYRRREQGTIKSTIHWGQRKLLLAEIEFLSSIIPSLTSNVVVVYAGAAPGDHLPALISLFDSRVSAWEFFDPREAGWSSDKPNIFQHECYLDNAAISTLLTKFKGWCMLLISDIREADYTILTYVTRYFFMTSLLAPKTMMIRLWLTCSFSSRGSQCSE